MNPGGSVKDRAALYVVKDAEEKGTRIVHAFGLIYIVIRILIPIHIIHDFALSQA